MKNIWGNTAQRCVAQAAASTEVQSDSVATSTEASTSQAEDAYGANKIQVSAQKHPHPAV